MDEVEEQYEIYWPELLFWSFWLTLPVATSIWFCNMKYGATLIGLLFVLFAIYMPIALAATWRITQLVSKTKLEKAWTFCLIFILVAVLVSPFIVLLVDPL